MKDVYTETIQLIERLHRHFLDVVKAELERLKIDDINNVQTLILYNINSEQLTIGELTARGYYLGSNVSYNVKKLVESGYLMQSPAPHDRRSSRIKLSDKGMEVYKHTEALFQRNVEALGKTNIQASTLSHLNQTLQGLEKFWTDCINAAHRMK